MMPLLGLKFYAENGHFYCIKN